MGADCKSKALSSAFVVARFVQVQRVAVNHALHLVERAFVETELLTQAEAEFVTYQVYGQRSVVKEGVA